MGCTFGLLYLQSLHPFDPFLATPLELRPRSIKQARYMAIYTRGNGRVGEHAREPRIRKVKLDMTCRSGRLRGCVHLRMLYIYTRTFIDLPTLSHVRFRSNDWADHFSLPHHREAWRWWYGRRVQGRGHTLASLRRAEVLA